eukprot:6193418-Pleurochrysis_carterae.AAC.1
MLLGKVGQRWPPHTKYFIRWYNSRRRLFWLSPKSAVYDACESRCPGAMMRGRYGIRSARRIYVSGCYMLPGPAGG